MLGATWRGWPNAVSPERVKPSAVLADFADSLVSGLHIQLPIVAKPAKPGGRQVAGWPIARGGTASPGNAHDVAPERGRA